MRSFLTATAALPLAACAMTEPAPESTPVPPAPERRTCDAAPVQGIVGEKATADIGARVLAETGARTLRWGPPRSAFTKDYRTDRVNVLYDDAMVIQNISCG